MPSYFLDRTLAYIIRMNVGIDGRPIERPASRYRGVGMYTRRLCEALFARNRALGFPHRFTVAVSDGPVPGERVLSYSLPAIRKPSRLQWVLDLWTLPKFLRQSRLDVFHATEFTSIPTSRPTRVIAHVHDMIPFVFWAQYSRRIPADYRWALRRARARLHCADCIITNSEHSKSDIVAMTGYAENRIHVVYCGTSGVAEGQAVEKSPGSKTPVSGSESAAIVGGRPYFLYVGGTDFRKNVVFLVRAFAAFSSRHPEARLVLAGETFCMQGLAEVAEICREIENLRLPDRVWMPGFVQDAQLRRLYEEAVALVFPSLYEGFGLPVLEAMTLGTPVVAARTSSVPEILGETGLYFDPTQEDSLVQALETVYTSPSLRCELAVRARERARRFSWEGTAEKIFRIYQELQ